MWENHWKPLFALISVRILLKQLDYEAIVDEAKVIVDEVEATLICNTPYPIYDLTKNSKPHLWPDHLHENPVSDLSYN